MRSRLSDNQRFLALCLLAGLLCGLVAVGFHFSIHHLFESLWGFAEKQDPVIFAAVMLGAPTFAGLLVGAGGEVLCAGCGWERDSADEGGVLQ
ncbi:MAG: hypothetical protein NWT08_00030 [Akkermansiaceae bacterium]|jgi:chloride channel protein, CIC family|nr:hypothetical protein [Akkermansiaceae bacterium]MDP4721742.1 hypothetical protein [Akkermansiaceae bacterium]MDP4898344.1 hypothetical protein [Akkermansiaceae bacterium]MDP4996603.1 hypothetical protein [Akkermansiaceae bacterium]